MITIKLWTPYLRRMDEVHVALMCVLNTWPSRNLKVDYNSIKGEPGGFTVDVSDSGENLIGFDMKVQAAFGAAAAALTEGMHRIEDKYRNNINSVFGLNRWGME